MTDRHRIASPRARSSDSSGNDAEARNQPALARRVQYVPGGTPGRFDAAATYARTHCTHPLRRSAATNRDRNSGGLLHGRSVGRIEKNRKKRGEKRVVLPFDNDDADRAGTDRIESDRRAGGGGPPFTTPGSG
mmetsp:Transcript_14028/g.32617  ORF Transcript_14028/g.32617 Transcript_14028/m.32617 type:complete len:133 (+) Transcript_14028:319-717(+)